MNKVINRIIICLFLFLLFSFFYCNVSKASAEEFKLFDNSPRIRIRVNKEKFSDITVNFTDYTGLDDSKIKIYSVDSSGNKTLLQDEQYLKSKKVSEKIDNKNVQYEYIISNSYLNGKEKKFLITLTDNLNNKLNSYFTIKSDGNRYRIDHPPKIIRWSGDKNNVSFISKSTEGTQKLIIYDMNDNETKKVEKSNLSKGESKITFNISKFKKVNDKYSIKIYAKEKGGDKNATSRMIQFTLEEIVREWQENYTVRNQYGTSTFNINFKTNSRGKTTFSSIKKSSNIMNIPYYNQSLGDGGRYLGTGNPANSSNYDHDYVKHHYDNGRGDSGWACGPFSYAMVASYLTGRTIAPYTYGDSGAWMTHMYPVYGCKVQNVAYTAKALRTHLLSNKPVILDITDSNNSPFTDGGHILVITGTTADGKFTVNNPNDFFNPDNYFGGGMRYTSYIGSTNPKATSWTFSQIKDLGRIESLQSYTSSISNKAMIASKNAAITYAESVAKSKSN